MVGSLVAATGRLRGQDTKWHKYRKALESTETNYCLRWSKITLNNILTLINDSYIGLFPGEGGRRCWVLTSSRCYHKPVPVVMTWLLMTVTGVLFHMKVIFSPFARAYLSNAYPYVFRVLFGLGFQIFLEITCLGMIYHIQKDSCSFFYFLQFFIGWRGLLPSW